MSKTGFSNTNVDFFPNSLPSTVSSKWQIESHQSLDLHLTEGSETCSSRRPGAPASQWPTLLEPSSRGRLHVDSVEIGTVDFRPASSVFSPHFDRFINNAATSTDLTTTPTTPCPGQPPSDLLPRDILRRSPLLSGPPDQFGPELRRVFSPLCAFWSAAGRLKVSSDSFDHKDISPPCPTSLVSSQQIYIHTDTHTNTQPASHPVHSESALNRSS
ncbi:unnamed protein product [Protopolystoma xenopodis]|uniref:Uncharacterized protein n=1 Tax=Protopolystoma xenopodis TaxID=117903 RepID=A0A448WVZ2_9PLAT|nr:unnamed protein product [Protopolystoma xenopodis]